MGFVCWYLNKYESMTYSLSSTGNNDVLQLKKEMELISKYTTFYK